MRSQTTLDHQNSSSQLLVFIGILWLLLAAALLVYQLGEPVKEVKVEWSTATEVNTAGFHLYRSTSPDGDFVLLNEEELIPGRGDAVSGATYSYTDNDVVAGKTYYYMIEEIEYDATSNRYDDAILSYKVPRIAWWAIVLTAVSILVGPALLITGLKENKNR